MKKLSVIIIVITFLLVGCSKDTQILGGESKDWKVNVTVDNKTKNTKYTLKYIGSGNQIENVSYEFLGKELSVHGQEDGRLVPPFEVTHSVGPVNIINEELPVQVLIKWNESDEIIEIN